MELPPETASDETLAKCVRAYFMYSHAQWAELPDDEKRKLSDNYLTQTNPFG